MKQKLSAKNRSRQLLAVVDQGISGLTNLLAVVTIARHFSAEAFGQFSIAYTALILFLACGRAYFGLPVAMSTRRLDAKPRIEAGAVTAVVLLLPIYCGTIGSILPFAHLIGGEAPSAHISWSLVLASPAFLVQDILRFITISRGRPGLAIASDGVWLFGVSGLLLLGGGLSPESVLMLWVATIYLSALVAWVTVKPRLSLSAALVILRPQKGARESATLVVALATGTTLAVGIMVAMAYSSAESGSLRGSGTLLGPVNMLIAVLDLAVLGRMVTLSRRARFREEASLLGLLFTVLIVWGVILLFLPPTLGEALLGDTWYGTRSILPFTLAECAFIAISAVASLELKARNAPYTMTVAKLIGSVVTVLGVAIAVRLAFPFEIVPAFMLLAAVLSAIVTSWAAIRKERIRHD